MTQTLPEIGTGATIVMYSDRHAATVVKVSASGKSVTVQRDIATRTDSRGMSENQEYTFTPDADAALITYTLRTNGLYVRQGMKANGESLAIGHRREYHDYSF